MSHGRFMGLLAGGLCAAGCAPRSEDGGFDSDNPAAKLHAIYHAGRDHDATAVPGLIEQLDSDDPAVRVYAIGALERVTGRRLGYNPYDSHAARREAVDRWVTAQQNGELTPPAPEGGSGGEVGGSGG